MGGGWRGGGCSEEYYVECCIKDLSKYMSLFDQFNTLYHLSRKGVHCDGEGDVVFLV